jgi:sugar lactone lactonase YvrE
MKSLTLMFVVQTFKIYSLFVRLFCFVFTSLFFYKLGTMSLGKTVDEIKYNEGSLYSLEVDGTVRKHKEGVSISNGLAWTADNKTMYYIDSIPRKVFGYDFDIKTGTMSKGR